MSEDSAAWWAKHATSTDRDAFYAELRHRAPMMDRELPAGRTGRDKTAYATHDEARKQQRAHKAKQFAPAPDRKSA